MRLSELVTLLLLVHRLIDLVMMTEIVSSAEILDVWHVQLKTFAGGGDGGGIGSAWWWRYSSAVVGLHRRGGAVSETRRRARPG